MKNKGIAITKPLQGYIVDRIQGGENIPPASGIFCGKCGGAVGFTVNAMKFPFTWVELEQNLRDTNIFVTGTQGVTCLHCDHTVAFQGGNMRFTDLQNYREWFPQEQEGGDS